MIKKPTRVLSDLVIDANRIATAGQQLLQDTLLAEMVALKTMLPALTAASSDTARTDADQLANDAAQDAVFDNMPV